MFGCYSQGLLHAQLVGGVLLVQKRGVVQNCSANSIYSTLYPSCYSGPSSLSPVHPHTSIYLSLYVSPSVCVCVCVSIGHTHKTLSPCVCLYRSHPQNAFSVCVSLSVTPIKRNTRSWIADVLDTKSFGPRDNGDASEGIYTFSDKCVSSFGFRVSGLLFTTTVCPSSHQFT